MEKGIIALPLSIEPSSSGGVNMQTTLSQQDLYHYFLYWDEIIIPTNNLFHVGLLSNEEMLIEQGLLRRPRIQVPGLGMGGETEPLNVLSYQLIEHVMASEPGKWVFMQNDSGKEFTDRIATERNQISVELTNLMPVPPADTPIEDILQFKAERKDELGALWSHLDGLCLQVQREPDRALAQRLITHELGKAIEDCTRVGLERWRAPHLTNFKIALSVDYKSILAGTAIGAGLAATSGVGSTIATLFGIAASSLKVTGEVAPAPTVKDEQALKLSYLSEVKKEFVHN